MKEAEQAAIDLLDAQQEALVALNTALGEKERENAALKQELATFQEPSDALVQIAQRKEWFDAFRAAYAPREPEPQEQTG